jgi:hypothetical protein
MRFERVAALAGEGGGGAGEEGGADVGAVEVEGVCCFAHCGDVCVVICQCRLSCWCLKMCVRCRCRTPCWCLEMCGDRVIADALRFVCLFGEGLGGLVGG